MSGARRADPKNTFALIVGIERYREEDWKLSGPANDAIEFADWLIKDRKVPPENVLLFLSPGDEADLRRKHPGLEYELPTGDAIYKTLTEKLARRPDDMLVVFWGGHGVIVDPDVRRLYYQDATEGNKYSLNFPALLLFLRSQLLTGFRLQVGIVDACANYLTLMPNKGAPTERTFPPGKPAKLREQFVLFSCRPGERAVNLDDRKTGQFSAILLEELRKLDKSCPDVWPPDMDELNKRVRDRFKSLREADDEFQQTPVFYSMDWEGSVTDGSLSALRRASELSNRNAPRAVEKRDQFRLADELRALPVLNAQDQWRELFRELPFREKLNHAESAPWYEQLAAVCLGRPGYADVLLDVLLGFSSGLQQLQGLLNTLQLLRPRTVTWGEVTELKRLVAGALIPATTPRVRFPVPDRWLPDDGCPSRPWLFAEVEAMANLPTRAAEVHPLLLFVSDLQARLVDANVRSGVRDWITRVARRLGTDPGPLLREAPAPPPDTDTPSEPTLLVKVQPYAPQPDLYLLEAWLMLTPDSFAALETQPVAEPFSRLKRQIAPLLLQAKKLCRWGFDKLSIEVFLPIEVLNEAVDQWPIPYGLDEDRPIGQIWPLVVRSYDRLYHVDLAFTQDSWTRKWGQWPHDGLKATPAEVTWLKEGKDYDDNLSDRLRSSGPICLALSLTPPGHDGVKKPDWTLKRIVSSGVPIALWLRRPVLNGTDAVQEIEKLLYEGTIDALPGRVQTARSCTPAGRDPNYWCHQLTLLLDRPDRLPPDA